MGDLSMYYKDNKNNELIQFRKVLGVNFTASLTDILSSDLFKIETIISDSLYRIYPLFYCNNITSTNADDKILDTRCIISVKNTDETYYDFYVNDSDDIISLDRLTGYYNIGKNLSDSEYNGFVSLLRQFHNLDEDIQIVQGISDGVYAGYEFNFDGAIFVDDGIIVTDGLSGTVELKNNVFKGSNYVLVLSVYEVEDYNVCDVNDDNIVRSTLNVQLTAGEVVAIPFNTLDAGCVVSYDARIIISHDKDVIQNWMTNIQLSSDKSVIQTGDDVDITATGTDSLGNPISGKTVYFYEVLTPSFELSANPSIIQTSETTDINCKVKDSDGSIPTTTKVYFYKKVEE